MKKYSLLLLLVSFSFLAPCRARTVVVQVVQDRFEVSSLRAPLGEPEIISLQGAAASYVNHAEKKMPGIPVLAAEVSPVPNLYVASFCEAGNGHAKSYLTHIYPSHYFW